MATVKQAIVTNNKQWLAVHVQYPLHNVLKKGYPKVKNKVLFVQYFDQIITPEFKKKVADDYTTNLFVKEDAVMLGDGEIWVKASENPATRGDDFTIIAINK